MAKKVLAVLLFSCITLALLAAVQLSQAGNVADVELQGASADLSGFDFENDIAYVWGERDFYLGAFYTPEDFAAGNAPPAQAHTQSEKDAAQYGTTRIVLKLPAGTYSAAGYSVQYSQRLYLDGRLARQTGTPGATKESTIPGSEFYTCFFTTAGGETELVVQYANFNHRQGGGSYPVYIGTAENIQRMNLMNMFSVCLIAGCLLTVFLYFAGLFLFHGHKRYYIFFALACLLLAVRALFVNHKEIMVFFPGLNWHVAMAAEYLTLIFTAVLLALFFSRVLYRPLNKLVLRAFCGVSLAFAALVAFSQPLVYSSALPVYYIVLSAMCGYVLWRLAVNMKSRLMEDVLMFAGMLVFVLGVASDMLFYSHLFPAHTVSGLAELSMMAFIYVNMVALGMQYSHTEVQLEISRMKEQELLAANEQITLRLRTLQEEATPIQNLACGPLDIDMASGHAALYGLDLPLTPKEFALLVVLARHAGRTIPTGELYEAVWKQPYVADGGALWRHMSRLKRKMAQCELAAAERPGGLPAERISVDAVRGEGYRLTVEK